MATKIKKPTVNRLRAADPKAFAQLCERAGCYSEAFDYFAQSNSSLDLAHAAELAKLMGHVRRVRVYSQMARDRADEELRGAKQESQGPMAGMGTALAYGSAQTTRTRVYDITRTLLR